MHLAYLTLASILWFDIEIIATMQHVDLNGIW